MKCLDSIANTIYKPNLIKKLTDLYVFKGKDYYYENIFKKHVSKMVEDTIEKDAKYVLKILDLNVKDSRFKSIIRNGLEPKTNAEKVARNLKIIFSLIQKNGENIILDTNEFLQLATRMFSDVKPVNYTKLKVALDDSLLEDEKSTRPAFRESLKKFKNLVSDKEYEPIQAITRLYVDIAKNDIFDSNNDVLSLIILYCLLFSQRFLAFKYVSFFEIYYNKMDAFKAALYSAFYRYEEGVPDPSILNEMIIDLMLEAYRITDKISYDKSFTVQGELHISKQDDVCSAILKLPDNFTKADVQKLNPFVSESTIARALEQLKKDKKIRSNGTGRSATWTKISTDLDYTKTIEQMSIYSFLEED